MAVGREAQQFGPFLIVRTLGRGGMGEVFVARTPWPKRPVAAVKRLRGDVARVPTFAERFQHESELAVRLEHQNVVGTLDVGSVDGQLYVASELVMGKDTGIVADRLRERGQGGPAAVAVRLMLDVLAGLAYVHEARDLDGTPLALVHRDITPGNVLIGYDGVARLADFGLAKSLLTERANLTQHGEILGTPSYLAPEIIEGGEASVSSDLYGLGAVVYRFLTGVAPHYGSTAEVLLKVVSEAPQPLSELRPDLGPWLVAMVHALLVKAPRRRPSDARSLMVKLGADAKAAGLLLPRSAAGRWLADLFAEEQVREQEEVDRLIAMAAEDFEPRSEGTVVLAARPRSGSLFRALNDPAESLPPEFGLAEVRSNGGRLGAAVPSDVTDAARVVGSIEVDAMPTRAMAVQPQLLAFDEESGTEQIESGSNAAPLGVRRGADRFEPLPTAVDDASSGLAGFIESGRRSSRYSADETNTDSDGRLGLEVASSLPVVRPVLETTSDAARPRSSRRPVARPAPGRASDFSSVDRRNFAVLGLMLAIAVCLGVFVGALVVSYRQSRTTVIAPRVSLREQLFRVQTHLVGRVERGEAVPAEVWSKVTEVHAALRSGDEARATVLLDELEADFRR